LWRQLALSGDNAHRELPDSRPGQKVLWRFCQQLWRLSGHNTQGGLIEPELLELMRLRGTNLNACTYCATVRLQPVANSVLSNRVYQPLPLWADLLVGFVWLGAVFAIAWRFKKNLLLALTLSLLATLLPAYLILKILIWCGYYTELLTPFAVAAVVTNVTVQFHHFLVHQGGTS
jgi:hypothetical protein